MRTSNHLSCSGCGAYKNKKQCNELYDIGFNAGGNMATVITICDACAHSLLQKLIIMGRKK